jgi:cold shock CspA family protein
MEGTVKFYNPLKGFGFIKSDKDYFFHMTQCPEGWKPKIGDKVEFTPVKSKRGWAAHAIKTTQGQEEES